MSCRRWSASSGRPLTNAHQARFCEAQAWPARQPIKLVAVFPPKHSILTITDTSPPIRGAGSGSKEAVLENGMKVKVNLLCDVGDKVRIDTETQEFKERIAK